MLLAHRMCRLLFKLVGRFAYKETLSTPHWNLGNCECNHQGYVAHL